MFKKIALFTVSILISSVILTACSNFTPLSGGPESTDTVHSNGGMSVTKGNYLYYVNGYKSSEDLKEGDNEYGSVKNSAIYRQELNSDGEIKTNNEGDLVEPELLIPKVAGFDNGGIYIFENRIFFTSPTNRKDKEGEIRYDLVDFYMADLNGDNVKRIHETGDIEDEFKFKFIEKDNQLHLFSLENSKLKNVIINGNEVESSNTIQTEVSSLLVPSDTEHIYYTRKLKDSDDFIIDKGNILSKIEIGTDKEEILVRDNTSEFTLDIYRQGNIYYRRKADDMDSKKHFYRNISQTNFEDAEEKQVTASSYSEYLELEFDIFDNYKGFVVSKESKIILTKNISDVDGNEILAEDKEEVKLLFSKGEFIYYTYKEDDNIILQRLNIITKETDDLIDDEFDIEDKYENLSPEYNNGYVYFITKDSNEEEDSNYIARVKVDSTDTKSEFLGVYEDKHKPDEEDENEDDEEE